MAYNRQILALDLAAKTGWALGLVRDEVPQSGSVRFAKEGASMAAVLSGCRAYLHDFLSMNPEIGIVVFEAPILPSFRVGNTTIQTIRFLMGMCGVVEELLFTLGKYDIREARVSDVRIHFLGSNRHKRAEAKALTVKRCQQLHWDPADDNAADALALWDYQRAILIKDDLRRRSW